MRSALLFTVVASLFLPAACSRPAPAPEPVRSVRTLTVGDQAKGWSIDYAGEVRPRTESRLSFRVGGKMVSRPVNVGDSVKAGQILASLDAQDLRLAQEMAQEGLEAARVTSGQAAADLKRFRELRDQGFISAAELDRRESAWKAAQAQYEQARSQAGVQNNQARYSMLVADISGVVTAVEAEPGAVLAAGAPVLRLALDGPRDVVFAVPEQHVSEMRSLIGKTGVIKVRLWGADPVALPASIREVAAAAEPSTRTFAVKADIGNAPVRLGQTATVSLAVLPTPGAFKLPLAAVFELQGKSQVWLLDTASMTVRAQPIVVVGAEGNTALVGGGLAAGQTIVSAGTNTLTPGQKVTLYEASPAASAPRATASR